MKQVNYQSRQWVTLLWVLLPLVTLLMVLFDTRGQNLAQSFKAIGLVMMINLLVLSIFGHLKICLDERCLRWHFGFFSWPRWQLTYAEIAGVEVCESLWYEGKGIRFTKEGMLYNASGKGAIRITKTDGKKLRIGSTEPEKLCAALQAAIRT